MRGHTVAGVHAMVSEIRELAASYREEGKRYFLQIEECSLTTSEVRTVCEALKKKIAKNIAAWCLSPRNVSVAVPCCRVTPPCNFPSKPAAGLANPASACGMTRFLKFEISLN
jgi:acyl-CoA reductase-like NAD-dependent aldehyde dehydrogenase